MISNLTWFEELIQTELPQILNSSPSADMLRYHQERIATDLEHTKKKIFARVTVDGISDAEIEQIIASNQKMILRLMDMLYSECPEFWKDLSTAKDNPVQLTIYKALDELRGFLEDYFYTVYDAEKKQSQIDLELLRQELATAIDHLEKTFLPYKQETYFQIMIMPLRRYIMKCPERMSMVKARYLQRYKNHLLRMKIGANAEVVEEACEKSIFKYNVNAPQAFEYLTESIQRKLEPRLPLQQKIYLLETEMRRFAHRYTKPSVSYRDDLPALKDQLQDWIVEEVQFLQKEIPLDEQLPQKLRTNLSVSEIALWIRVATESNIISGDDVTRTVQWAADHLESKKAKAISCSSLRNKYYQPEDSSLTKVEEHLESMRNRLRDIH